MRIGASAHTIRDAPTSGHTPIASFRFGAKLTKAARATSRGGGTSTVSLDDPKLELDSEPIVVAVGDRRSTDLSWCERIHLRQDLDRVLHSLPQHLQDTCHWIATSSVTEAAGRSGLARGSIYSRIATLKRAFAAAGLDAYLASPCPTLSNSAR
jgi:hypothetical protein